MAQKEKLLKWMNEVLEKAKIEVKDYVDLADGVKFIRLVELATGRTFGAYNKKPVMKLQKIDNMNKAISFLGEKGVKIEATPEDLCNVAVEAWESSLTKIMNRYTKKVRPQKPLPAVEKVEKLEVAQEESWRSSLREAKSLDTRCADFLNSTRDLATHSASALKKVAQLPLPAETKRAIIKDVRQITAMVKSCVEFSLKDINLEENKKSIEELFKELVTTVNSVITITGEHDPESATIISKSLDKAGSTFSSFLETRINVFPPPQEAPPDDEEEIAVPPPESIREPPKPTVDKYQSVRTEIGREIAVYMRSIELALCREDSAVKPLAAALSIAEKYIVKGHDDDLSKAGGQIVSAVEAILSLTKGDGTGLRNTLKKFKSVYPPLIAPDIVVEKPEIVVEKPEIPAPVPAAMMSKLKVAAKKAQETTAVKDVDMAALGFDFGGIDATTAGGRPTSFMQRVDAIPSTEVADAPSGLEAELASLDNFLGDLVTSMSTSDSNPISNAKCKACGEGIINSKDIVYALGDTWHAHHMMCAKCQRPRAINECDDAVYCDNCYSAFSFISCAKCSGIVPDAIQTMDGQSFHPRCFLCDDCGVSLAAAFFKHEGGFYCELHYYTRLDQICAKCSKPILDKLVKIEDKKLHSSCFSCEMCKNGLVGKPYRTVNNDKYYCKECHAIKFG